MSSNRSAIVTGGGSGIGRNVALALAGDGWKVVVAGRRKEALEETAAMAAPGQIVPIPADVVDVSSVDHLFDEPIRQFGRLDLLFNNAGMNTRKLPLDELGADEIKTLLDVNLFGTMLCARAALRVMKAQRPQGGRIINNGSISARAPRPNSAPYTASKHAITGLTKSIAVDGRPFGIAACQIDIGNAATKMSAYSKTGAAQADGSVKVEPNMSVANVGMTVLYMANLPVEANIPFITLMATNMPLFGRG
jgi:NAD(P)-dependent dehydrogenase (short-subunit alcohol dehydrogenase family)